MVLMAAVLCFGMTFGLTVYACYTKTDFTTKGAALFMFSISLFFFGFLLIFFHSKALYLLYSFLGVCLYGMWLIYDT
jgi:FtsH-binding integral membrane protein